MLRLLNWRFLGLVGLVATILAVALWPETIEVEAAAVSRGTLQVTIDDEGETRVRQRFVVSAPVSGRLQRIQLEPGDRIERGQVLTRLLAADPQLIDPRTGAEFAAAIQAAEAALGQARAERQRVDAALERRRSVVVRQRQLLEAGAISRDQLESYEAELAAATEELRAANFAVERAQQELKIAQERLSQPTAKGQPVEVRSPAAGVVLKRHHESETDVPAGEPLLEVGNPNELEIVSDLLSTDAVRVSPGDRVLIDQWGGVSTLTARVRRVEPSAFLKVSALGVEEQRVNVIIDFENAGEAVTQLGDGYRVEVRVVVSERQGVLKAPVGSLFRHGEKWAAFVIEEERAHIRVLDLGERNNLEAEVLSGLSEDALVVVHPPDTLADASRVVVRTPQGGF